MSDEPKKPVVDPVTGEILEEEITLEDFAAGNVKPSWTPRVIAGGAVTSSVADALGLDADGNLVNAEVAAAEARAEQDAKAKAEVVVPGIDWMSPLHYRPDVKPDPAFVKSYPPVKALERLFADDGDAPQTVDELTGNGLRLTPDMWPQEGYLKRYMDLVTPTTDAPGAFHLATALVTLATALGPRWTVEHQSGGLTPNLWFLLVADSGSRKSTAMKMALQLLPIGRCWTGAVESTKCFMEHLRDQLDSNALWFFDEANSFFNMIGSKTYATDLAPRLTSAYNGDVVTYANARELISVTRPHLSILTGTPLAWLRGRGLDQDFLRGGVFGRFLLVPASHDRTLLAPPALDPVGREDMIRWLAMLTEAPGKDYHHTLSHGAKHTLLAWMIANKDCSEDLALAGIWNRRSDFALKLALLYHVAALRQPNQAIQQDSMEQAVKFVHYYVLPGQLWALKRIAVSNPHKRATMDIEEALEANPQGIRYASVAIDFGLPIEQAQRAVYALWCAGKLEFWRRRDPYVHNGKPHYLCARPGLPPQTSGILDPQPKLPPAIEKLREKLGDADNADDLAPELLPDTDPDICGDVPVFDDGLDDE